MNNKLFVGNLDFSTTEQQLREMFEAIGPLQSVALVLDRMTGQSRGFGFVEFESDADAQRAIESLNGTVVGGRSLNVNVARERTGGGGGGGGGGCGLGGGVSALMMGLWLVLRLGIQRLRPRRLD